MLLNALQQDVRGASCRGGRSRGAVLTMLVTVSVAIASVGCTRAASSEPAGAAPQPSSASAIGAGAGGTNAADTLQNYSPADVRFLQRMIPHHAQALLLTGMVDDRTESVDIRNIAERIEASQESEIELMRQWLIRRGEDAPDVDPRHAHHMNRGGAAMPGMLTEEQLARLEAASGTQFDKLFLEYMIEHHEGALVMVGELFATAGAGEETEIFRLASDVDADQRAEIRRLRMLLEERAKP